MPPWLHRALLSGALVAAIMSQPPDGAAQLPETDPAELERLAALHGRSRDDIAPLLQAVAEAGARGLPQEQLLNKIKEGLAKGVEPARIERVLREMSARLGSAHRLFKELGLDVNPNDPASRRSVKLLSEVLGRKVTAEEIRDLARLVQQGGQPLDPERLAYGAKLLAMLKDRGIDGTPLIAEGLRHGYTAPELLHLGRELRHDRELLTAPGRLDRIREELQRGRRMDELVRELRQERRESGRSDRPVRRPHRPPRFDRPAPVP